MDSKLLEILVCPVSKTSLYFRRQEEELWCRVSRLAYPVRDGLPVMIEAEARPLTDEEYETLA
ncbi:MAG: Trm112 family protein [Gammaproteobacteria bacterium]|nr:Trm112 family protein [Gammaproteobacteria bacterium]